MGYMERGRSRRSLRLTGAVLLTVGAVLGAGGCSGSASTAGTGGSAALSGAHLGVAEFAKLAGTSGTVVLDVRTPAEFSAGHLAAAVNLDLQSADFAQRLAALDHGASYAVYCHSGRRSGIALEQMRSAGFTHAADLSGGVTAWTADGRSLVTGS